MVSKKGKVSDLIPDSKNFNKHSNQGTKLLDRSIKDVGLGRSVLVSSDNVIIAGNGVTKQAAKAGIKDSIVVESDGTKLIVVRRTDIKSDTPEFFKMALADNLVAQKNIVLDAVAVEAVVTDVEALTEWATEVPGFNAGGADDRRPNMSDQATYTLDKGFRLVLQFATEEEGKDFAELHGVEVTKKSGNIWSGKLP